MRIWKMLAATALVAAVASPALAETPAQLEANKKVAVDFYTKGLQMRNMDVASSYLTDGYIQHNPMVPTGKAGFVNAFSGMWSRIPATAPPPQVNMPVLVMAENDLVTLVFKRNTPEPGQPGKTYESFWFDTFRINNGKITEHWDPQVKPVGPPPGGAPGGPPGGPPPGPR